MADAPSNQILVLADGPLLLRGDVVVEDTDGTVLREGPQVALCRCGGSANQPFCDGAHGSTGFQDPGEVKAPASGGAAAPPTGRLVVRIFESGPAIAMGSFDLQGVGGTLPVRDGKVALCRCGTSDNKPMCDGSHA